MPPKISKQVGGKRQPSRSNGVQRPLNVFEEAVSIDQLPETGYRFLIYGQSGSGKTTLACTFPKPLLLIRPEEVEDGSRSVRKVSGVFPTPFLTTPDQLTDVIEGQAKTRRYKTLVLDGVNKYQDLITKKHMGLEDVPVQNTFRMVDQADWNLIGITFKSYMRDLLRLTQDGTHVVLVGGERVIGEGGDNTTILAPTIMVALIPGCSGWVHEVCDYNVHAFKRSETAERKVKKPGGKQSTRKVETGGIEYCLRIEDSGHYATKFRMDKEVDRTRIMVNPTFGKLDSLIRSEAAEE